MIEVKQKTRNAKKVENNISQIRQDYAEAFAYQYSDPQTSLTKARAIAEEICTQLILRTSPDKFTEGLQLTELITRLTPIAVLPRAIKNILHTVRVLGNFDPHRVPRQYITTDLARACLYALAALIDWYFQQYCAEAVEQLTASETSVSIFISYHHPEPDFSFVQEIEQALKQEGHQVFIDNGNHLYPHWMKAIEKKLEQTDYFLVLLSPQSVESAMLQAELAIARSLAHRHNGIPIILPVRMMYPSTKPLPYDIDLILGNVVQESWHSLDDSPRLIASVRQAIANRTGWPVEKHLKLSADAFPKPSSDPRDLLLPGGAIAVDSHFYIKRPADAEVLEAINCPASLVRIRGSRQTGKTSLVKRIHAALQSTLQVVFIDFQAIPGEHLQSLNQIWRVIADRIARQLQIHAWDNTHWNTDGYYDSNLSDFLEGVVFQNRQAPLLLCFDEIDRVFHAPPLVKSGFFASIRSFYNESAMRDALWRNVRWLLVTSSEPSFFIENLTESPFNVGSEVKLNMFTPEEVATFAQRYGLTLQTAGLDTIMDYVGGQPYLTHLLLHHLAQAPDSYSRLFDVHLAGHGIFKNHLRRYLIQFQKETRLANAMHNIIQGNGADQEPRVIDRLEAAGLIHRDRQRKIIPLCRLYAEFFGKELQHE